ncbi:uncharacterized protein LODBEIA_P23570 [Lodderomyces beijingensis]|uniref:Uncharacterized protein n=1 Tax=Lodderomyces beijingensis TaxID=1775926 RepID=A0ABP0ZKG3_9ASCO
MLPWSLQDDFELEKAKPVLDFLKHLATRADLLLEQQSNHTSYNHFLRNMVWVYYHLNDIDKLAHCVSLLRNHLDEQTIAYHLNALMTNYEFEAFKAEFKNIIINNNIKFSANLFDFIVTQLISSDCLFEILFHCYQVWDIAPKCERPTPESMCKILHEMYKYGTYPEVQTFESLVIKHYGAHFSVQSEVFQNEIKIREYISLKKNLSDADYDVIERIMPDDNQEVEAFCLSWVKFMALYSDLENVKYIIQLYHDKTGESIPPGFFKSLVKYYRGNNQFHQLLKLFKESTKTIPYNEEYLKSLAGAFIDCYSRFAPEFVSQLNQWLGKPNFFKLQKLESQFTPFHLAEPINLRKYRGFGDLRRPRNSRSYDNDFGGVSGSIRPRSQAQVQVQANLAKAEVRFRIEEGFPALIERGIRPDVKVVYETFRAGGLEDAILIKNLLQRTRQYNWKVEKLFELRTLQHHSLTKEIALRYFRENKDQLNDSHKFIFIRILINFDLFEEAQYLLDGLDTYYMNDKNKAFQLNLQLRMYLAQNEFQEMIRVIKQFPLESAYLYPSMVNNCIHVESALIRKLRKKNGDGLVSDKEKLEVGQLCLSTLRDFTARAESVILEDDGKIPELIASTFETLDEWRNHSHQI